MSNTNINKNHILISSVILCLFYLHNYFKNDILFFFLGLTTMLITICFCNNVSLIYIAMMLTPNVMMIKLNPKGFAFLGLFILLMEMKYFIKKYINGVKIQIPKPFYFFCFFTSMSCLINTDEGVFLAFLRTSIFLLFIYNLVLNKEDIIFNKYEKIIFSYLLGNVFVVLLGVLYWSMSGMDLYVGYFSGINNDRNYFSSVICVGVAIIISHFKMSKSLQGQFIYFVFLVILSFAGIISGSRTFFIAFILILLNYVMSIDVLTNKNKFILLGISIFCVTYFLLTSEFVDRLLERFQDDDVSEGNGRFEAWIYYLSEFMSGPLNTLFGCGGAINHVSKGLFPIVEHNSWIQALFSTGVISTFYFFYSWYVWSRITIQGSKFRLGRLMPLLTVLITYSNISGYLSDNLNIALFIVIISMMDYGEKEFKIRL